MFSTQVELKLFVLLVVLSWQKLEEQKKRRYFLCGGKLQNLTTRSSFQTSTPRILEGFFLLIPSFLGFFIRSVYAAKGRRQIVALHKGSQHLYYPIAWDMIDYL